MPFVNGIPLRRFVVRNASGQFMTCKGWVDKLSQAVIYTEAQMGRINYPPDSTGICWLSTRNEIMAESPLFHSEKTS